MYTLLRSQGAALDNVHLHNFIHYANDHAQVLPPRVLKGNTQSGFPVAQMMAV